MNKARALVRPLTATERRALETGRKSADAFAVRRPQVLPASAARTAPTGIGRVAGYTARAVRDVVRAFEADGPGCLAGQSHARKDSGRVWGRKHDDDLKDLPHRRPRGFGQATGLWALAPAAEVRHANGWTPRKPSVEGVRHALIRPGVGWKRAKHWITSPDPEYAKKKRPGTG